MPSTSTPAARNSAADTSHVVSDLCTCHVRQGGASYTVNEIIENESNEIGELGIEHPTEISFG